MPLLKKRIRISILVVVIFVTVVIVIISPLTKYLIQKYDVKYTGREIKMDWVYVNPFTGYVHFDNLKVYELRGDTVFFFTEGLSANMAMLKLFSKTYEISELSLNNPQGHVIQNEKHFNFSDLITKFSPKENDVINKEPIHLNILNIKIRNGTFYYHEIVTPIKYFIKNVNLESVGFRWDADTIPINFSFLSGVGKGDAKGAITINSKTKDYRLGIVVQKFDLNFIGQYIKDLSNYGSFKAFLDADFKSRGNFVDRENVTNSGLISVSDFHFGKDSTEDFAAFDNLNIVIKQISPKKFIYKFDSISLKNPYFKYEKYDYLDNVQTMFGKNGANIKAANADEAKFNLVIELAHYIKTISKNLRRSNYNIDRLGIYNGEITYNDYSLGEKFAIKLESFNFEADSVYKTHKRVNFKLTSDINPYGNIAFAVSINPKDSSDFDLKYHFQKIPLSMFNPYVIKYTSFPLDRGTLEIKGLWNVRNGEINSHNHLILIDPRIGEKSRNNNSKWMPLRLAMFFVRERGNVIDYEVPIVGNLKNPKFKLYDVIVDALENTFVKPLTTSYRYEVKNAEMDIEKSLSLKWEMKSSLLTSKQEKFLTRIAYFLDENPLASITVYPEAYELKEKEYILFYEAKKKYVRQLSAKNIRTYGKEDSLKVERLSIKDSLFMDYLNAKVDDALLFTVQDKCIKLIGASTVDRKYRALSRERLKVFKAYFKENGTEKRVKIGGKKSVIPYNGFSFYEIHYKGVYPDYLLMAYRNMNKFNHESPRDKFNAERKKIGK